MATTKKSQFKINNGTDWDTYHFETDSTQVKHKKSDGTETTVENVLNSALGGMAIQTGRVTITPKPNEPTMKKVTFPKPFKSQPGVVMTVISSVPGINVLGIGTSNNTKDGFEAYVTRINDTETILVWVAVGPM
uniref:H-type lectin domain n=2 Tax=root TaxID=1 RepID=A0A8S5PR92_9CAUD|nr:MAG TPA: H-type lectin domain [Siphoviridae sp. ctTrD1]